MAEIEERRAQLQAVAEEVRSCTECPLHKSRTQAVPGEGPVTAEIMFIGEAPGFHEDQQGRPFVGASGKYLVELLESIGMKRSDVFITNVVRCRPPGNRDPLSTELDPCDQYTERQIDIINPKVIVTLGRFSMAKWFPNARISRIHGEAQKIGGRLIVPFYHPAAALRSYTKIRPQMEADFQRLPQLVKQIDQFEDQEPDDQPEQLSLF
jgi:DNA polymerase